MQNVDRPAYIQALSKPAGAHGLRIETKPLHIMRRAEPIDRIGRHRSWRRHLGQDPTVRSPEAEGAVGLARHLVALLVYRAVVPATEQGQVRERGRASLRPVSNVMPLREAAAAAREAAAAIPVVKRAPQRRRNRPRPRPDVQQASLLVMAHHHPARVARQTAGRFCGNAHAVLEDGLARLIGIREHGSTTWTTTW